MYYSRKPHNPLGELKPDRAPSATNSIFDLLLVYQLWDIPRISSFIKEHEYVLKCAGDFQPGVQHIITAVAEMETTGLSIPL